jgi:hypothetical protein
MLQTNNPKPKAAAKRARMPLATDERASAHNLTESADESRPIAAVMVAFVFWKTDARSALQNAPCP